MRVSKEAMSNQGFALMCGGASFLGMLLCFMLGFGVYHDTIFALLFGLLFAVSLGFSVFLWFADE